MGKTRAIFLTLVITCLFLKTLPVTCQEYVQAPEKWSFPTKIGVLSNHASYLTLASVTPHGDTIYLCWDNRLLISALTDTGWNYPADLNDSINAPGTITEAPSISPDGKILYFRRFVGEWRILFSRWNDSLKVWGSPEDAGSNINQNGAWYGMTPDNEHFYFFRGGSIRVSTWDDTLHQWGPSAQLDPFRFVGAYQGVSITKNLRKIYYDSYITDSDIIVHYFDTLTATWSYPMRLNIDIWMDSTSSGKLQQCPWISSDGHQLYFMSNYDNLIGLWESHLVIDENGDSVIDVIAESPVVPSYSLEQNYPNPFNPGTTIVYSLPVRTPVKLEIYDILGRRVATLVDQEQPPGRYTVRVNSQMPSTGLYFVRLSTTNFISQKKILFVR